MKNAIVILILFVLGSCNSSIKKGKPERENWTSRSIEISNSDTLFTGSSYLSVYSEIYDFNDETTHLLTATISIRNISLTDSIFISTADYYNTKGNLIRSYITNTVYVLPMETVEIIIHRDDISGGTGANFNFDWAVKKENEEPLFEAVMIWVSSAQGVSFTTRGVKR
jgi:hypothetical protein